MCWAERTLLFVRPGRHIVTAALMQVSDDQLGMVSSVLSCVYYSYPLFFWFSVSYEYTHWITLYTKMDRRHLTLLYVYYFILRLPQTHNPIIFNSFTIASKLKNNSKYRFQEALLNTYFSRKWRQVTTEGPTSSNTTNCNERMQPSISQMCYHNNTMHHYYFTV
jgi:hypothetical protein